MSCHHRVSTHHDKKGGAVEEKQKCKMNKKKRKPLRVSYSSDNPHLAKQLNFPFLKKFTTSSLFVKIFIPLTFDIPK